MRTNLRLVSPHVRTVKTASGATAVQIVYSSRRGSRDIEHLGSAHDDAELEALKAAARQRLTVGQGVLDRGWSTVPRRGPLEITSSRMGHLWDALGRAFDVLGFADVTGGDEVFRDLVLARVIQSTSKLDALRVLAEVGVEAQSYRTVTRRLPGLRDRRLASRARHGVCSAHESGGGEPGALRRVDAVFRDRRR